MSMMLARNPADRASAHDLLQHPFIRMYAVPARAHSGGLAVSKQSMSRRGSRETNFAELKGVQRKSSSNASSGQGGVQTLPLSFSLRHNELADPTMPERMVLKVGGLDSNLDLCAVGRQASVVRRIWMDTNVRCRWKRVLMIRRTA